MRTWVQSLALFSGLRIRHCHEPCCRLQMWLRSHMAVAVALNVASSYSSSSNPGLETSIYCGCSPKKTKNKNNKKKMSSSLLVQVGKLSQGSLSLDKEKEGQRSPLGSAVFQIPLIYNNQYVRMAYFGIA